MILSVILLLSCCRNVHGECFEFNGTNECQNKISTLTCLPCAKNFSSHHCASGRFDNFDMQYADVESHETKMFELRIQRVHSNIIDPLSCKNVKRRFLARHLERGVKLA